ncbi:hypothetical protein ABZW32_16840 [Streptomyces sp. NPDC004667]|uniref:hypothetical protein n=1 Tax=Streptomyces sp. NPDC004667 TaxID=3154285 RepID=UPI0033BD75C6
MWGITRQGARKKWPDAITRPAPPTARTSTLEIFGGTAEPVQAPSGGWTWTGKGADGASGAAGDGAY